MNTDALQQLLEQVRSGTVPVAQALERLRLLPYEDLGFAKIDHHRRLRCGFPEVIFCLGKTPAQVAQIAARIVGAGHDLLATRASAAAVEAVRGVVPQVRYEAAARCLTFRQSPARPPHGKVLVVSAGTSDSPVAEEARVTAEMLDSEVQLLLDVGVAGIHRLLGHQQALREAGVIIVVAGMEGALASVVGGLTDRPVIAVPTSVGYGASFGGLAPLLTMLNSCAAGVAVVNIDNGFGAGYIAALINRTRAPETP